MTAGSKSKGVSDLPQVQLKYPGLEAFTRAAKKTFKLGRMTLKSRKVFKVNNRLVLCFIVEGLDKPVEVIGQIIDVVPPKAGDTATYGIRFLNFTQKKLDRLLSAQSEAQAPKPAEKDEAEKPPEPQKSEEPVKAPPPEKPAKKPPKSELKPVPEKEPADVGEETEVYTIEISGDEHYMKYDAGMEESKPEPAPSFEKPLKEAPEPTQVQSEGLSAEDDIPDLSIENAEAVPEKKQPIEPEPPSAPVETEAVAGAIDEDLPEKAMPEAPEEEGMEDIILGGPDKETEEEPSLEKEAEQEEPKPDIDLPDEAEPLPAEEPAIPDEPPVEAAAPDNGSDFMEDQSIQTPELSSEPETAEEPSPLPEPPPTLKPPVATPGAAKDIQIKPMSPPEYQALAEFLMRVTRPLLQPLPEKSADSERIMKSLYQEFKTVMSNRDEIGLFIRAGSTGKDFILEGTDTEPKSVKAVFQREVCADLVIKLADLFEKKKMIGLTLRRYSTEEAYKKFLEILGGYSPSESSIEELVSRLVQAGAYHLTPIFSQDQIPDSENLNWRVAMALSRLSGEMKRLLMVANAVDEDPRALFTLRVEDAIKPIQKPELLAELILSCRLAMAGQTEFTEADLQSEIIFSLPLEKLVAACELLALIFEDVFTEIKSKPEDEKLVEREQAIRKTLRRALARVSFEAADSGMKILRHLYSQKVLSYDELPEVLRGRIDAEQAARDFVRDPRHEIDRFERISRPEHYKQKARQMAYVIIEMLRTDSADVADLAFKVLVNHRTQKTPPFPERPRIARESMEVFCERDSLSVMVDKLGVGNKDERELAAALFYSAGEKVVRALLDLLIETEDRAVRRLICDVLIRQGEKIAPALKDQLYISEVPWYMARNILMVLTEIGSSIIIKDIDAFIAYDHPRVREEALGYLVKICKAGEAGSEDPEPKLVRALRDPDALVRRKAVQLLGQFKDFSDFTLQGLVWMMEKKPDAAPSKEEEMLFIQAAELLGKMRNRRLPEGRSLEEALIKIYEQESRGLLGRIASGKGRTPKMRAAIIETLGRIGGDKSKKLLAQASKDREDLIKKSAQTALARLKASAK